MTKKVFVISHSHWDREWYLPFEQHRLRLVKLLDEVLDLIDCDPEFNSFQLDGQAIIIDDYLEIRPENKGRVKRAVQAGKLRVGPFYVLQDDFLISPEAHVKDFQIGRQTAEKYGPMMKIGYFPDTFGNMGQTPQMLRLADLDAVAFGRGVKPTGLNNQVAESAFESSFSEMMWTGPDQSKVLGILFANWYSNGNEIPVDPEKAKVFWTQKLADVEKYASTDNLLMMNGVDHQPVQKDISAALAVARQLFPDYEFIHSNFDDYLAAVKADLPENLSEIKGELTSQETDGWYTLTNTASSRVYLKQQNVKVQLELINEATQLAAIVLTPDQYPNDQLTYAWKLLLQNDIHDSITGCSIDTVHREMMTRYAKVTAIANAIRDESEQALLKKIDTSAFPENSYPFVVINTSSADKTDVITTEVEIDRAKFSDGRPDAQFAKMQLIAQQNRQFEIVDVQGNRQLGKVTGFTTRFGADLPENRFRVPYMAVYAQVELQVEALASFSWQAFALAPVIEPLAYLDQSRTGLVQDGHIIENDKIRVNVSVQDGTIEITDKQNQRSYRRQLIFEDVGDIGNEYIFKESTDQQRFYSSDQGVTIQTKENSPLRGVIELTTTLQLPVAADAQLDYEQRAVIDVTKRQAKRSEIKKALIIRTQITLTKDADHLNFKVDYDNVVKDHRLRVLFPTGINSEINEAESVFEVAQRSNLPNRTWQNPSNPQRQQAFVNIHDAKGGLTVANLGLNEYEILPETGTIAITLLRSIGELGDWGYFPTPEAQCQGPQTAEFAVFCHGESEISRLQSYQRARAWQVPLLAVAAPRHKGLLPAADSWLKVTDEKLSFAITGVQRDANHHLIVRGYNMSKTPTKVMLAVKEGTTPTIVNFLSEPMAITITTPVKGAEIRSYRFN